MARSPRVDVATGESASPTGPSRQYHGGFFTETRRIESIKAHAALGGRLVHGCQSSPNMSGGVVAPYGVDVDRFTTELNAFKGAWRAAIHAKL